MACWPVPRPVIPLSFPFAVLVPLGWGRRLAAEALRMESDVAVVLQAPSTEESSASRA
jgi:hypothetical protein